MFGSTKVAWFCRAGHYAYGVTPFAPVDVVCCVDDSHAYDQFGQREGVRFFSLERRSGERHEGRDSAMADIIPAWRDDLNAALRPMAGERRLVMTSIPSASLSAFAAEHCLEVITNPPELQRQLNDKSYFFSQASAMSIPPIPGRWTALDGHSYQEFTAEFGRDFVAQAATGVSGSGTAFISSEADYLHAGARFGAGRVVHLAPNLGALSVNINAIAMDESVVLSWPSVQLEGLPMLSAARGMYCGNDFVASASLPSSCIDAVYRQTTRVGEWLRSQGFRGIFGIDFVVRRETGEAWAVDLNPRWQGSTAPLTLAQQREGMLPLAAAEMAWLTGAMGENEVRRRQDGFLRPLRASHGSLRCPQPRPLTVTGSIEAGIYTLGPEPAFLRPGFRLTDLRSDGELLLSASLPRPGTIVHPGSHLLRAVTSAQVLDMETLTPLKPWEETVASLYSMLGLV